MDENLFRKVPVKVQQKSGFDLSFQNLLTTKVGTITPVLCEELIPNETVHLKAAIEAQLPPLASDTFMRCDLKYEAFFVPNRLIMAGYEEWLVPGSTYGSGVSTGTTAPRIPLVRLFGSNIQRGTLADYLGFKAAWSPGSSGSTTTASTIADVNALPFLAYHRIYDDWYRNTLVQKPIYRSPGVAVSGASRTTYSAMNSRYVIPDSDNGYILNSAATATTTTGNTKAFYDGVLLTDLRQRNFGWDYFTTATPDAQNGEAQGIKMTVDAANTASFSIGQLRAANSIQMWLERNLLAGNRLQDYVKANYGANLSDGIAQRSLLLGSGQFAVYTKGIYQQSTEGPGSPTSVNTPFTSVGAKYGSAQASGYETIVDSFTAMEPGYLFVMCTLVPKVTYATGVDRKLSRYITNDRSDMANHMLQGVGNQPVWTAELSNTLVGGDLRGSIFGYTERYADWKSKNDEVHGLLREGILSGDTAGTLSSFALQSSFDLASAPQISSQFLQIPTDYLDNVAAVKGDISKYGCWIDSYFDFRVSMPLARYSLPTLQDPAYEHGDTVVLDRGGKRI
jgi:hypothetical protein